MTEHQDKGRQDSPRTEFPPPSGGANGAASHAELPAAGQADPTAVHPETPVTMTRRDRGSTAGIWARRTFESLAVRDFRFLWLGMLFQMAGMNMQMFTRGLHAYDLTGSATITAIVSIGWAPTMLGLSLISGAIAERVERRSLIQFAQTGNFLIPAVLAGLTLTGHLNWSYLFFASLLQGIMFATMMPARQAIIPQIVGRDRVSNALALNATAMGMMNIIGQAAGGVMYDAIGPGWSYAIGAGLSSVSIVFTSMLPKMYPQKAAGPRRSTLAQVGDGLAYIRKDYLVKVLLLQGLVVTLLAMPFRMLIQVFADERYGSSASGIGLLAAAAGVGSVIGALYIAGLRPGQRRGAILLAFGILSGVALLLAGLSPWYAAGLVAMGLAGIGESARMSLGQSLVIEHSQEQYRARVMSVLMMTFGLMPIATLPLGAAYDAIGAVPPVVFMGAMLVVLTAYFVVAHPKLRRLQ